MTDSSLRSKLRLAHPEDEALFLEWRNSSWSVALSGTQRVVSEEEHAGWFTNTLTETSRLLFVIEEGGNPVGMVRYEVRGEAVAEVTLAVVPERLGQGLGTASFLESVPLLAQWRPVRTILARVRRDNTRSLAFFRHLGFRTVQDDGTSDLVQLELTIGESQAPRSGADPD